MRKKEEKHFLAFLGIYDYEEKRLEIDLNYISGDMYQSIYYMSCRDIETGDIVVFLKDKNGKNEIKEVLETYYQTGKMLIHPSNQVFSLGEFAILADFYQQKQAMGTYPTVSEMHEQVENFALPKSKKKVKIYRK